MDIAMTNPTGTGFDFAHDGTDLIISDGLLELLINTLFRDARAPTEILEPGEDPRGHWSTDLEGDTPDGSLLWTLRREKITPNMPYRVAELMEKACAFMITATEGPAEPVVKIQASCKKANQRGRIEGELILFLNQSLEQRRFSVIYDPINQEYNVKEVA